MKRSVIKVCCCALCLACLILLLCGASPVDPPPFMELFRYLEELPDWEADIPQYKTKIEKGMKTIMVSRAYAQKERYFEATIMIGNHAIAYGEEVTSQHSQRKVGIRVMDIDGFQVQTAFNKDDQSGLVNVILKDGEKGAFLALIFVGMTEEEGLKLARTFDWENIQQSITSLGVEKDMLRSEELNAKNPVLQSW